MKIDEIRRENLVLILSNYGKDKDFAEKLGLDAARLSQLKHGHENIGEKTARQIEKAAGKPERWLDMPTTAEQTRIIYEVPPEPTLSEEERLLLENFRALCPDQKATLKTVSAALAQSAPTKKAR